MLEFLERFDFIPALDNGRVILGVSLLLLIVLGIIFGFRYMISRYRKEDLASKHANNKNVGYSSKYPEANIFGLSNVFFRVGLFCAMVLLVLAFNWTTYDEQVYIPAGADDWEEIEQEPPRTAEPPKPPPPPPPPVIEEVPEEEVEEEVEFEDLSVEEETEIQEPEPIVEAPPPPPEPEPEPEPEEEEIFTIVQQMPRFPGCEDIDGGNEEKAKCAEKKMLEFIYKNIKYPPIARENGIEGRVFLGFVVEKDGSISDLQILRAPGGGLGEEAFRIAEMMPKWVPGKQRNRAVRVKFTLPVLFKLN